MTIKQKQAIETIAQAYHDACGILNIETYAMADWLEAEKWVIAEEGLKARGIRRNHPEALGIGPMA